MIRSVAARARIAAKATFGPPQSASARRRGGGASDVGVVSADELGNVPAGHDHGVPPRPFQLSDLVAPAARQLGDRELPRRDVLEQVEHPVERPLVTALARREQEDLWVDTLERRLQLRLVPHLDGTLQSEVQRRAIRLLELNVLVRELCEGEHAGVSL